MLSVNALKRLHFLPEVHDMRFNAETLMVFIKSSTGHNPYKGDIYIFMSKDRRQVRMVHQTKYNILTIKQDATFMERLRKLRHIAPYSISYVGLIKSPAE